MPVISNVKAREIIDSRGNPTVEAQVELENGITEMAAVPSGASTGEREAVELRDNDPQRYLGKGVLKAVANVNQQINQALRGQPVFEQAQIDQIMLDLDGTSNKSNLGANAILAVSMAAVKAAAKANNKSLYAHLNPAANLLPVPMMNIINGGAHADNSIDLQEFMILPVKANSFAQSLRYGAEIFHHLKAILQQKGLNTAVGDEGGFAPNLRSNSEALDIISLAVEKAGFTLGKEIFLSLDVAASEFYKDGKYILESENKSYSSEQFVEYLNSLAEQYPIISIEDGMDENDWQGWQLLSDKLAPKIQLVGDDLFVTNSQILAKGIERNIANSILIKVNQIGTISETLQAIEMAKAANYTAVMSHRSGETEDHTIADLAVATEVGQIKTGSMSRSDRIAKYNQLLRIEEELGSRAVYAAQSAFKIAM